MNHFWTILTTAATTTAAGATLLAGAGTARAAAPSSPFVDCFCVGTAGAAPHVAVAEAGEVGHPPWPPPWPWPCPPRCDPMGGACSEPALDPAWFFCQPDDPGEPSDLGALGQRGDGQEGGAENRAIAENVDSPGSSAYASQSQYAPVRQAP